MIKLILKLKDTKIEEFNLGKSIINIGRSKDNDKGKEFKITKEVTTVGKGAHDDIPAGGWLVSSPQAKISRPGDRFYISHLGGFLSSTKVNGIEIQEDHILKNKDEVEIGNCAFVFTQSPTQPPG